MWPPYRFLPELPRPPEKFFDMVHKQLQTSGMPTTSSLHEVRIRFSTREGQQFLASPGVRTTLNGEWEAWVRENIVSEFNDTGVNWRQFNSDTSGIHTDTTRRYTLSWNILNGGPDCGVTFWQEEGQPLVRERGIQHLNFDTVKMVDSFVGPFDQWFLIDACVLHSAENIDNEPRLQFQISLEPEHIPEHWNVAQ